MTHNWQKRKTSPRAELQTVKYTHRYSKHVNVDGKKTHKYAYILIKNVFPLVKATTNTTTNIYLLIETLIILVYCVKRCSANLYLKFVLNINILY